MEPIFFKKANAKTQLDKVLLDQILAEKGKPLSEACTLPPAAYTDEAFFELEVEKMFKRDWLCVAHVSQLPNVGDYQPLDLFGQLLMIVRGEDRIRVLSRVCLHRWAPLVNDEGNARSFKCPFHAWGYGLDGRLLGAPYMDQATQFDRKACRLPELRSEIVDGFLYVNFDENAPPLAPQLTDMLTHQGHFRSDELVVAGSLSYDCKFNWKIAVETFMECYHHLAAHPITFERDFPARLSWGEESRERWTIVHSPARQGASEEVFFSGLPFLPELTEEERKEFRLYLVYPYQMISTFADRMIWFRLQPISAAETRLQTYLLIRPETAAHPGYAQEREKQLRNWDAINLEDIVVNEMQQKGAATWSANAGRLSHLEIAVWQLAEYIRKRLNVEEDRNVAAAG